MDSSLFSVASHKGTQKDVITFSTPSALLGFTGAALARLEQVGRHVQHDEGSQCPLLEVQSAWMPSIALINLFRCEHSA